MRTVIGLSRWRVWRRCSDLSSFQLHARIHDAADQVGTATGSAWRRFYCAKLVAQFGRWMEQRCTSAAQVR